MLQYFTVVWSLYLASTITRISVASHELNSYGYFTNVCLRNKSINLCLLFRRTLHSGLECVDRRMFFGDFVKLVRFIACRYFVMVRSRFVILKSRKRLVHAVTERVLPEMSVILWIGEIFLTNLWYPMGNNKNVILMKGRMELEWARVVLACSVVMN